MNPATAVIRISNLRLRTFIGFNPDERTKQQDVVINVEIHHELRPAALHDDVSGALDYKAISKAIIRHVEQGRFLLLEKLTHDLIGICSRDPAVLQARVTVDKPHALRFADSVSITLEYQAQSARASHEVHHDNHPRPLSQAS
ncbi:MAG: dihydroneopterin triphosphate 2'-epimerase [Gammaproteobacteria bacterium]|nr:dihydroneopterin triphosphate 2'-epimerase [Gammaproteobacteria bacterium]